jgi:hypothetical protein
VHATLSTLLARRARSSGGLAEAFIDVPLKLIALAVAIGVVGAVLGKGGAKTLLTG